MKHIFQIALFLLGSNFTYAQTPFYTYDSIYKEPINTLFYEFVDGFQIIEVDHLGAYWHGIEMADRAWPRGLSAAVDVPRPVSNEYYVRDSSGRVVQAFCTDFTLEELNERFADSAIEPESIATQHPLFFAISNKNARSFRVGYYEDRSKRDLRFGVINRKGEQVIPVEYQQIHVREQGVFLMKNDKWALMDNNLKLLTDFEYDDISVYPLRDSIVSEITYLKKDWKFCAFRIQGPDEVIETPCYERMETDSYWAKWKMIVVVKDGKRGLIDFEGNIVIPAEYDRINLTDQDQCENKPCVKLVKGDSVEFVDINL